MQSPKQLIVSDELSFDLFTRSNMIRILISQWLLKMPVSGTGVTSCCGYLLFGWPQEKSAGMS